MFRQTKDFGILRNCCWIASCLLVSELDTVVVDVISGYPSHWAAFRIRAFTRVHDFSLVGAGARIDEIRIGPPTFLQPGDFYIILSPFLSVTEHT